MGLLQRHDSSEDTRCAECQVRQSVGPCAACHGMVCGDCCTLVTDPSGKRVICLSCTRMVASISRNPLTRTTPTSRYTAWALIALVAIGVIAALLRS